MNALKKIIKNNPLMLRGARSVRELKNRSSKLINQLIFNPLPLTSKYVGSPKKELTYMAQIERYVQERKKKGDKVEFWRFLEGEIAVPAPELTVGTPDVGAEIEPHTERTDEHLLLIPNGRVYKNNFAVVTDDDYLVAKVSVVYSPKPKSHLIFNHIWLPRTRKVTGRSLLLYGGMGYYHAMIDCMPILCVAEMAGFQLEDIDHFVLLNMTEENYQNIFSRAGIPREKIINLKADTDNYEFEELLVGFTGGRHGTWYSDYIQKRLQLKRVENNYPSKIYVSRKNAIMRRVLNEPDVVNLLASYGFEEVLNEKMSLDEQMSLYAGATHIISTHGANLVNLIFCQQGAKLCEIRYYKHKRYYKKTYYEMAHYFGLDYFLLYCQKGSKIINNDGVEDEGDSDVHVDLEDLKRIVEGMALEPIKA